MAVSSIAKQILFGELRNFKRHPSSRKWLFKEKCFALSIYKRSPRTYRFLRQHITLPSETTLKEVLADIVLKPGVSPFLLQYNFIVDEIDGFEDFGERGRTHVQANHLLQFKIRLLHSDFTFPIAHYPVNGTVVPSQF